MSGGKGQCVLCLALVHVREPLVPSEAIKYFIFSLQLLLKKKKVKTRRVSGVLSIHTWSQDHYIITRYLVLCSKLNINGESITDIDGCKFFCRLTYNILHTHCLQSSLFVPLYAGTNLSGVQDSSKDSELGMYTTTTDMYQYSSLLVTDVYTWYVQWQMV